MKSRERAGLRETAFRLARAFRVYRRPIWLRVQRILRRRVITVGDARSGMRFECLAGADRMFPEIFSSGHYDVPLAPLRPGDIVVDVGANHGFATAHFARQGATVLAFEPHRDVFAFLLRNVKANGLEHLVRSECVAISDYDGVTDLFETPRMGGGMSSLEPRYVRVTGVPVARRSTVPVRSIAAVLASVADRRIRLLKLDCEGSELRILKAIDRQARGRLDSVALEYHAGVYTLEELMLSLEAWSEFSISKPSERETENLILHLVRREVARQTLTGARELGVAE